MPGLGVFAMPRRRSRTEIRRLERENAAVLGEDYKFSATPSVAAKRRKRREARAKERMTAWSEFHRDKWTGCLVPGCKFTVPKRLGFIEGVEIALCTLHQVAVWEHVNESLDDPDLSDARKALRARRDAIALAEAEEDQRAAAERRKVVNSAETVGQIYYARVGNLIKVGWTTALYQRIRSYGADAELLAHYAGTRADETNLHRQLQPSRAKGREWYHDDAIIRAFVALALREHGEPKFTEVVWTRPKQIVAGKRTHFGRTA